MKQQLKQQLKQLLKQLLRRIQPNAGISRINESNKPYSSDSSRFFQSG